jgi:hypothetical protein
VHERYDFEKDSFLCDKSNQQSGSLGQEDWNGQSEEASRNLVGILKTCVHECELGTPRIHKNRRLSIEKPCPYHQQERRRQWCELNIGSWKINHTECSLINKHDVFFPRAHNVTILIFCNASTPRIF